MIAGRAPFQGKTPSDVIVSILEKEPAPLTERPDEVPAALGRLVDKALRKDRTERFQSAKELLEELMASSKGKYVLP